MKFLQVTNGNGLILINDIITWLKRDPFMGLVETRSRTPRPPLKAPSLTSYGPKHSYNIGTLTGCTVDTKSSLLVKINLI